MNDAPDDDTGRYRTEALRSIHCAAEDLHATGAIDEATMRKFDESCLTDADTAWLDGSRLV